MLTVEEFSKKYKNKTASVIGIGVSNRPLIDFLLSLGIKVIARDRKNKEQIGDISDLSEKGVRFILGDNYLENINEDIVFRSPGIRYDIPELVKARENGSLVTSEMQLFFELCPCHIIGITGSDGKTTTTTIISKILEEDGKNVFLGGNIGRPLIDRLGLMEKDDYAVVELSSFQLHTMKSSPEISIITNISPNHLDYHKSMDEYVNAKFNILRGKENRLAIFRKEDPYTEKAISEAKGSVRTFSLYGKSDVYTENGAIFYKGDKIMDTDIIRIPGSYNIENYMAAIGALYGIVSKESVAKVASTFPGVEHRCEFIRELNGVSYYNSSIDSSPSRTAACLSVFKEKVIAILGGYDKNLDYSCIGDTLVQKTKAIIITGATKEKIKNAVLSSSLYKEGEPLIIEAEDLKSAADIANSIAKKGDTVVLTPASASFDSFKNFEERGRFFKKTVNDYR